LHHAARAADDDDGDDDVAAAAAAAASYSGLYTHQRFFVVVVAVVGSGSYKTSSSDLGFQQSHQEKTSDRMAADKEGGELSDIISSEEESYLESQVSSRDLQKAALAMEEERLQVRYNRKLHFRSRLIGYL
jgi:hypothetical protein